MPLSPSTSTGTSSLTVVELASASPKPEVHPDYNFDDADLILSSSSGTHFRVHSLLLTLASTFFRDMLSVKRSEDDHGAAVPMTECTNTLRILLDMVYPSRNAPLFVTIDLFRILAVAADKYDMPNVTSALKDVIVRRNTSMIISPHKGGSVGVRTLVVPAERMKLALECYFIAVDLNWTSEAQTLCEETLAFGLDSELAQTILFSATNRKVAKDLVMLHSTRIAWIYNAVLLLVEKDVHHLIGSKVQQVNCTKFFKDKLLPNPIRRLAGKHGVLCIHNPRPFRRFPVDWYESHLWWKFKAKVLVMLKADVSGASFLTNNFYGCSEFRSLLGLSCCDTYLSSNEAILKQHFKLIVEHTPKTLEGFRAPVP